MSASAPQFDVVVFGATGVTGREVARYLHSNGANWAAAGRDAAKLERTLADVGAEPAGTIAADVADPGSLAEMASRATVVLNLVGPYTTRGRSVIAACVAAGTHYADLTGEIPFVREIIDEFEGAAAGAGVKIVQVCGFEALPPDLAVHAVAEAARERGSELVEVDVAVSITGQPPGLPRPSDMISGGTFQSMAEVVGARDPEIATDPAALIADPAAAATVRERSPIELGPRREADGTVIGPMTPAAFINPAVIHRTAALAADDRGSSLRPFRYREGVAIGGSGLTMPLRLGAAAALSATQRSMRAAMRARPAVRDRIAAGLRRALPGSGFGPAADRIEQWRWRLTADGRTAAGEAIGVRIDAEGHPGYLATARMIAEAGLMIAEAGVTPERAGCLTPALALGTSSLDRFDRARLHFTLP
jgi:short subunit dehydrogenase-like uncharacterized protein